MLWLVMRGAGYAFAAMGYDGEVTGESPGTPNPLDCARCANMRQLRSAAARHNWARVVFLLAVISGLPAFEAAILPPLDARQVCRQKKFTNKKYLPHMDQLEGSRIIELALAEHVSCFSTYFSVPKNKTSERSIFNGKSLSKGHNAPPPVNIPDIPRVIREMAEWAKRGRISAVVGDFRHFFHQLEMAPDVRRFFGVAIAERVYRWCSVPMGWSWSPVIAQACAWTVLSHYEETEQRLVDDTGLKGDNLPIFLPLLNKSGVECGFVTVYYDNYLAVSICPDTSQAMSRRILRNANLFNIRIKLHEIVSEKHMLKRNLKYLGCEFGTREARDRCGQPVRALTWRLDQGRLQEAVPLESTWLQGVSPRTTARRIGRVIHSRLIELQPLGRRASTVQTIAILRRICAVANEQDWDAPLCLSQEENTHMESERRALLCNDWRVAEVQVPSQMVVASDASSKGYGYVFLSEAGEVLQTFSAPWPQGMEGLHIFQLEAFAACEAIRACTMSFTAVTSLTLVTDNTAVAGAMRRGYSTSTTAMRWMAPVVQNEKLSIHVVTVVSEHNVADEPSRLQPLDTRRIGLTLDAVRADCRGIRVGVPNMIAKFNGHVRHQEHDTEE